MITNTSKTPRHDWLFGMNPGAIEKQEAQGQREFVESTLLPTDFNFCKKEDFEALGFKFGEPVEGDPMFCEATLPDGWKKRATDHSMWSEIVDDTGKVRAMIFYKAAFYDRDAFIRLQQP